MDQRQPALALAKALSAAKAMASLMATRQATAGWRFSGALQPAQKAISGSKAALSWHLWLYYGGFSRRRRNAMARLIVSAEGGKPVEEAAAICRRYRQYMTYQNGYSMISVFSIVAWLAKMKRDG